MSEQRLIIDIDGDNPAFARDALSKAIQRINSMLPGGDIVVCAHVEVPGSEPPTAVKPAAYALRLPQGLYDETVREAAKQGVSVNTLIVAILAGALKWKAPK